MDDYRLYDAELRLMELVWQLGPVNSTQLTRRTSLSSMSRRSSPASSWERPRPCKKAATKAGTTVQRSTRPWEPKKNGRIRRRRCSTTCGG